MQLRVDQEQSKIKQKNTFSTDSSKRQNEIDADLNFKIERQKYLEQRKNRRQQIKNFRKQNFGSSSSESQPSAQKTKPKQIIKDYQLIKKKSKEQTKNQSQKKSQEQEFHAKHQAYIKEKLSRKKQLIEQRRKEFGTSSSDSDQQFPQKVQNTKNKPVPKQQLIIQQLSVDSIKEKSSSRKRSFQTESAQNPTKQVNRQYLEAKEKGSEAKKITVLVQSKKNMQWIEETMVIQKKRIKLINQNVELMIAYVTKIKLFFTKIQKDFMKMKITIKQDDYFFALSSTRKIDNLDEYYYVFSRIIHEKLIQIGFEPKKNEPTIFPNYMNLKDVPLHLKNTAIVFGKIMKKSQVLGNWETRFVYITNKEIGSSKKANDKPSMIIPAVSISEIWSRFDIENNNMLKIKIMYNSGTKTEFGIPISNFTDELNWLHCFYRIISPKE